MALVDVREQVVAMLVERGVTNVGGLLEPFEDDLEPVVATVRWFDDYTKTRDAGAGLLVKKLREGGMQYKSPADRQSARVVGIDDDLRQRMRRIASCPMGFRRDDLESIFREYATRELGISVSTLIDSVLGPWTETPPHPCHHPAADWNFPDTPLELRQARYSALVAKLVKPKADLGCRRRQGESDWAFAHRFWSYIEPPEIQKTAQVVYEQREIERRRRAEEKKELAEARRELLERSQAQQAAAVADADLVRMEQVVSQVRPYGDPPEEDAPW